MNAFTKDLLIISNIQDYSNIHKETMHNNAPTQNIDIALGDDLVSATTTIFKDSKETFDNSSVQTELDEGLILLTVEAYLNDASIIPPNEKSRIIL